MTSPSFSTVLLRFRHGGERIFAASATRSVPTATFVIIGGLAIAWLATYWAGGTGTVMPHLFYVPVVTAASRFGGTGALVVGVAAGLLSGPLMPLHVDSGTPQPLAGQLVRMMFFTVIGQTVALLSHRSFAELSLAVRNRRMGIALHTALRRGEFDVVYQPLFNLRNGTVIGVEALLRWEDPHRGTVTPDQFIEDAEQTGAIVPIGAHVLFTAAGQVALWRERFKIPLKVAVNISARQLEDDTLPDKISDALVETGLPPEALQLEITETAVITDLEEATSRIARIRALGVAIAIDDFGTGQSSLAYLHRFRADVVKIDRAFVRALECDAHARAVAEGVVRLSTSLKAVTVAEGIETAAQAAILRQLSCDVGQGYYYARPGSPFDVERLLLSQPLRWPDAAAPGAQSIEATAGGSSAEVGM